MVGCRGAPRAVKTRPWPDVLPPPPSHAGSMNTTTTMPAAYPGRGSHAEPAATGQLTTTGSPLVATGLVHRYTARPDEAPALRGVHLTVTPGESLAVMGPSGSGKTTLLHVLAGVLRPTEGSVHWRGADLTKLSDRERSRLRRSDFGFVFQSGQLLPELPAGENAALPLMLTGVPRATALARAQPILDALGLTGLADRRPGELSGGQAQRVAIARALAANPGVVFADEPTGALDRDTGAGVLGQLLAATRAHGAALVVVTHDSEVAGLCQRVVTMRDGAIVHDTARALQAVAR